MTIRRPCHLAQPESRRAEPDDAQPGGETCTEIIVAPMARHEQNPGILHATAKDTPFSSRKSREKRNINQHPPYPPGKDPRFIRRCHFRIYAPSLTRAARPGPDTPLLGSIVRALLRDVRPPCPLFAFVPRPGATACAGVSRRPAPARRSGHPPPSNVPAAGMSDSRCR